MRRLLLFFMSQLLVTNLHAGEPLSLEDITGGTFAVKSVGDLNPVEGTSDYARISDDGQRVETYSFKTGKQTGVLFDGAKTQADLTFEYFDDYRLSPDGLSLLIQTETKRIYRRSFKADWYIWRVKEKSLMPLSVAGDQQEPTFSPDGKHIAFVRDNNIFVTDGQKEVQITHDGRFNEVINGIPDWVNEEEFGFSNAMAWSDDGATLSWIRYDESQVKTYALQLFKGLKPEKEAFNTYPGDYSYKYPKAGEENARVSVWSYEFATGQTRQLEVPLDADGYVPRIKTMPGNGHVVVFTMNRHQDLLRLYDVDPISGACRQLIEESVEKYVKEEVVENVKLTDRHILLPSDRDGFMHLYLYDRQGTLVRQIEHGDYEVTDVYGYDEKTGDTYFQAAYPTPMNRTIFVVDKNGNRRALSSTEGWNSALFSCDFNYFVKVWSNAETPYIVDVCNRKGHVLRTVIDNHELREQLSAYDLQAKEFFKMKTSEGVELNGWMLKPANYDRNKVYPVVMHQYSGPGSQQVVDSWRIGSMGQGALFDQYLAQQGFIVVCVDGRGTGGRGAAFEKCTYLHLGELEAKDQVEVAQWIGRLPFIDSERIGIWGWSYGGFNTLMSMSEGRPVFRAGVAIAPPTDWRFYDSVYTERYMRTPQENPDGYDVNPIGRATQLHGALLVCHGLADDNVHPQNTFEFSEALVQADKDFRELIYTNRNHSIYGGNTRNHLLRQVVDHFKQELHVGVSGSPVTGVSE